MSESDGATDRTITVAEVSDGPGGDETAPGATVSLPIVEVLTGRAFVTGKSGSGKSNSASVVAEELLEEGFGLLIVDVEGEYYGLKEEFELLHAGADEECDIQVSPEHAEKLATLALDRNVPIVLDVSGYLDEETADELVFETARHLFAKEKKLKKPFLLLVEEIHEYIPENGSVSDAGQMLVKIGKRGRKHGLGLMGISQRPANVKKDYITQCDWLVWHRLTWDNDTKVVRRVLDGEHADAVEDLDDGEAFLMTDWSESVRRVQFHRKRTFDAGATPGLDDFERPELKSVDGDLVEELREITEERERRESTVADLRQELERKEARIEELEAELERARDLERMADRFSQALLTRAPVDDGPAGEERAEAAAGAREAEGASPGPDDGDRDRTTATGDDRPTAWLGSDERTSEDAADDGDDPELGSRARVVEDIAGRVDDLDDIVVEMLCHVRAEGPADPVEAHVAAGGTADRELAYSRLRTLRRADLVEHASQGRYAYAVPDLVRSEYDDRLDDEALAEVVAAVEERFVDDPEPGWSVRKEDDDGDEEGDADDVHPDDRAVELLDDDGGGDSPAFREDDAEYVDETGDGGGDETSADGDPEPVTFTDDGDGMAASDARGVTADEGRDAAWVEGADEEANGQTDHDAARDAEFVD